MYVCICHAVRERDIIRAVAAGATSFQEVQDQLSVATGCGACRDEANRYVQQCLDDAGTADAIPALSALA